MGLVSRGFSVAAGSKQRRTDLRIEAWAWAWARLVAFHVVSLYFVSD